MPSTLTFRAASITDLKTVLGWIANREACLLWAGPKVEYFTDPLSIWSDIEADETNTFGLKNEDGDVLAFGQILLRSNGTVHLARIIVAPQQRQQGIGRQLCLRLMQKARTQYRARQLTLNVYRRNTAAASLYRSLGFVVDYRQSSDESWFMRYTIDDK